MNWSSYSRFVGDVFGAPLAMEGLAAFFLESVFLGPVAVRLGPAVSGGSTWPPSGPSRSAGVLSAAFIMAANSWMQRPVGYQLNAAGDRAQLTDVWAVLTNIVFLWAVSARPGGLAGHRRRRHAGGVGLAICAAAPDRCSSGRPSCAIVL
jgi:cytochrome d ubiquinol oxidase subunit I